MCTSWPGEEQQLDCSGEGVPSSQPGEATRYNSCGPHTSCSWQLWPSCKVRTHLHDAILLRLEGGGLLVNLHFLQSAGLNLKNGNACKGALAPALHVQTAAADIVMGSMHKDAQLEPAERLEAPLALQSWATSPQMRRNGSLSKWLA